MLKLRHPFPKQSKPKKSKQSALNFPKIQYNNAQLCLALGKHETKPYNHTTVVGSTAILSPDSSSPIDLNGEITDAHCKWLRSELALHKDKTCFLITHHHLLTQQHEIPIAKYPAEFSSIIKESNLQGIFTGHTHHFYLAHFAGKAYVTSSSLSFIADRDPTSNKLVFREGSSANLYAFCKGALSVQIVPVLPKGHVLAAF